MSELDSQTKSQVKFIFLLLFFLSLSLIWASFNLYMSREVEQNQFQQLAWGLVILCLDSTMFGIVVHSRNSFFRVYGKEDVISLGLMLVTIIIPSSLLVLVLSGVIPYFKSLHDASYFFTMTISAGFPLIFLLMLPCSSKLRVHSDMLGKQQAIHYLRRKKLSDDYQIQSIVPFESLTRRLLDPGAEVIHSCPKCLSPIDFRENLEWYGPTAFMCINCDAIIHLHELGY